MFFAVEFLQKCFSELRSYIIGAQLRFSARAIRESDVNDTGGNSIAAANFVAVFIDAADVDFSGSGHFGLRKEKHLIAEARSRVGLRSNVEPLCPHWVKSGPLAMQKAMSALPPKADICSAQAHVRFG